MNSDNSNNNTSGQDEKPYDLAMINAICDNNPDFMGKLILVFTDTTTKDLVLLKEAAAIGDWREAGQLAHKMKSSINHFQVKAIKETIAKLEHYQNSSTHELNLSVLEFERIINNVLANLKEEFSQFFSE